LPCWSIYWNIRRNELLLTTLPTTWNACVYKHVFVLCTRVEKEATSTIIIRWALSLGGPSYLLCSIDKLGEGKE
jgi:hypothetical protein